MDNNQIPKEIVDAFGSAAPVVWARLQQPATPQGWLAETGQGRSKIVKIKMTTIQGRDCARVTWDTPVGRATTLADVDSKRLADWFRACGVKESGRVQGAECWGTWGRRRGSDGRTYADLGHVMPVPAGATVTWTSVTSDRWQDLGRDADGYRLVDRCDTETITSSVTDAATAVPPSSVTADGVNARWDYGAQRTAEPADVADYWTTDASGYTYRKNPSNKRL